ncbi:MAG: ACP S-malonyltransferase [Micrococcaceae bacterium]
MLAIVCPGQGSQTPGMLTPWLDLDGAESSLNTWSDATGIDLLTHGTASDEETIKDTAVAQPLVVAAGLLSAQALELDHLDLTHWITAGHSVGEITATALAGVLTPAAALDFVRVRATGMARAAAEAETGMAAVLGGDAGEVLAKLDSLGLTPANINGGGQVVAAGSLESLTELAAEPPAKARVIQLKVAGAFHTDYMAPAVEDLRATADTLPTQSPRVTLLSNRDGATVVDGPDALDRLVSQVTSPVRWDLCMESLASANITGIVELLPGGTLKGLAKRALRGVPSVAITSPDDLDAAREFITEHTA